MNNYLNRVQLIGNVGKDPEIRTTVAGKQMAKFSVATSKSIKNKNTGEYESITEWHRIVVLSEREAKICEEKVSRGSKVYVEGAIKSWKKEDKSGIDIIVSDWDGFVKIFDKKDRPEDNSINNKIDKHFSDADKFRKEQVRTANSKPFQEDIDSDDIPF